jgi:hypothetical protein
MAISEVEGGLVPTECRPVNDRRVSGLGNATGALGASVGTP